MRCQVKTFTKESLNLLPEADASYSYCSFIFTRFCIYILDLSYIKLKSKKSTSVIATVTAQCDLRKSQSYII